MAIAETQTQNIVSAATAQRRTAWWLTAPALGLMVLILLVPVVIAGILSFTDYSLGNDSFNWVGTKNYDRLFSRSTYEKMLHMWSQWCLCLSVWVSVRRF